MNLVLSALYVESKKQNKQRQHNRNSLTETENKVMAATEERRMSKTDERLRGINFQLCTAEEILVSDDVITLW